MPRKGDRLLFYGVIKKVACPHFVKKGVHILLEGKVYYYG
jgi:hypothetical protein